jgi:hypothetical protein
MGIIGVEGDSSLITLENPLGISGNLGVIMPQIPESGTVLRIQFGR